MGCCPSRHMENKEDSFKQRCEIYLRECEESLGIHRISSKTFVNNISRYSYNKVINHSQFKKALTSIGLDTGFLNNDESMVMKFYKKFENYNSDSFSPLLLKTLGVLMGKESLLQKATMLFLIYDEDCSNIIEYIEFKTMIDHILLISIDYCLDYAIDCNTGRESYDLQEYKTMLKSQKHKVFNYFRHIFMYKSDSIDKEDFIMALQETGVKKIFSTKTMRDLVYEYVSNASVS